MDDEERLISSWALSNQQHRRPFPQTSFVHLPPLPDGITAHPVVPASLSAAMRPNSKSPGRFECPRCGKVYRWKGNLKQHLNVECGKEPRLQCPYCPHRCKHKSSMNRHMKHLHAWSPGPGQALVDPRWNSNTSLPLDAGLPSGHGMN